MAEKARLRCFSTDFQLSILVSFDTISRLLQPRVFPTPAAAS
jgi:hypothetical protein